MGYFREIYHRRFIIKLLLFVYSALTGLWLRAIKNWLDKSNVHMCHSKIHTKSWDCKLVARISPSTMLRCHSKLKQIFVNYISTYRVQTHWLVMEIFVFPKTSADWNSLAGLDNRKLHYRFYSRTQRGETANNTIDMELKSITRHNWLAFLLKLNYLQFKLITHRRKIFLL